MIVSLSVASVQSKTAQWKDTGCGGGKSIEIVGVALPQGGKLAVLHAALVTNPHHDKGGVFLNLCLHGRILPKTNQIRKGGHRQDIIMGCHV